MTVRTRILCLGVLALVLAPARAAIDLSDHILFERADGLWGKIAGDDKPQLLSDRAHYEKAAARARLCYVLLRSDDQQTWLKLLECDAPTGTLRLDRTLTGRALHDVTAIESATYVGERRVRVDLHVNPSASVLVEVDLSTGGRTLRRVNPSASE